MCIRCFEKVARFVFDQVSINILKAKNITFEAARNSTSALEENSQRPEATGLGSSGGSTSHG
jgi:hypothetical protein